MKEYTGDKIRNVAIVGHGGAGTTSVTEALLYRSGAISRMCKVEDGATTTDYEPEEIKRKVSVNATLAPVEWRDTKINFIDTPGFADFVAEVKGAFRAVDSALIVVCATSGVQVGTEQCWKLAEEAGLPRIIFVNKMDRENADFDSILDNLQHVLQRERLTTDQVGTGLNTYERNMFRTYLLDQSLQTRNIEVTLERVCITRIQTGQANQLFYTLHTQPRLLSHRTRSV